MYYLDIQDVLMSIDIGRGRKILFEDTTWNDDPAWPSFRFRLEYMEEDIDSGQTELQYGRWWYIEPEMERDAIIKTVWLAATVSDEHVRREWFTVDGKRIFNPHAKLT